MQEERIPKSKRKIGTEKIKKEDRSQCNLWRRALQLSSEIQGPPKQCIHTLTKENSMLYNRLL